MPRVNRCLEPGAIFHIMNRGVERRSIFSCDEDRTHFIDLLKEVAKIHRCKTLAYCLMGNHFHLVLKDEEAVLSKAIRWLTLKYARAFNIKYDRDGSLFRGRFKSVRVLNDVQLLKVIDYVHINPVKDGFVDKSTDWKWSSVRYYETEENLPEWMESASI